MFLRHSVSHKMCFFSIHASLRFHGCIASTDFAYLSLKLIIKIFCQMICNQNMCHLFSFTELRTLSYLLFRPIFLFQLRRIESLIAIAFNFALNATARYYTPVAIYLTSRFFMNKLCKPNISATKFFLSSLGDFLSIRCRRCSPIL